MINKELKIIENYLFKHLKQPVLLDLDEEKCPFKRLIIDATADILPINYNKRCAKTLPSIFDALKVL